MKSKAPLTPAIRAANLESNPNVKLISMSKIIVREDRSAAMDVDALVESISTTGLMHPITVTKVGKRYKLVGGLSRFGAFKKLRQKKIPANILTLDKVHAQIAEKDENLYRKHFNALDLMDALHSRRKLMEKHGLIAKPGGDRKSKKIKERAAPVDSFAESASRIAGIAPRTVNEYVKIAEDIPVELRDKLKATPVASSKAELKKISKMLPNEQKEVVDRLSSKKATTVSAAKRDISAETESLKRSKVLEFADRYFTSTSRFKEFHDIIKYLSQKLPTKQKYIAKNRRRLSEHTTYLLKLSTAMTGYLENLKKEIAHEKRRAK